jgi:hypothetical protein
MCFASVWVPDACLCVGGTYGDGGACEGELLSMVARSSEFESMLEREVRGA